jgi:hypothetical protein
MNTSGIEILSGQDSAEQRNISALQLRDRNALNFGLVFFKDRDELFVARILFANALFVRKGNIRNAAVLRFAAVFHNEMDTIADNDSHRIDPRISASLTDGGLPCPAQASAAQWLKPSSMAAGIFFFVLFVGLGVDFGARSSGKRHPVFRTASASIA